MKKFTLLDALAHLALFAMSVVWVGYGWHLLLEGGFYKGYRYTNNGIYVDGIGVFVMAYIFFSLAAITSAVILKRFYAPGYFTVVTAFVLLGSPVLYFIAG
jgi:hypothetical protein